MIDFLKKILNGEEIIAEQKKTINRIYTVSRMKEIENEVNRPEIFCQKDKLIHQIIIYSKRYPILEEYFELYLDLHPEIVDEYKPNLFEYHLKNLGIYTTLNIFKSMIKYNFDFEKNAPILYLCFKIDAQIEEKYELIKIMLKYINPNNYDDKTYDDLFLSIGYNAIDIKAFCILMDYGLKDRILYKFLEFFTDFRKFNLNEDMAILIIDKMKNIDKRTISLIKRSSFLPKLEKKFLFQ